MKRAWIWIVVIAIIVVGGVAYYMQQPPTTTSNETETIESTETTTTTTEETTTPSDDAETAPVTETTTPSEATETAASEIKNPNTLIVAAISDIDTLDPHYIYDTASGEVAFHVYDNLIAYDGPYTDRFVPMLSTDVPSLGNGLIVENSDGSVTLRFPIRQGVTFHNGNELTPEDVAYSFHRLLLFDRSNGPSWLVLDPLFGVNTIEALARQIEAESQGGNASDIEFDALSADSLAQTCARVKQAVQVEGDAVEFHLPRAFPPFLSIIAHSASWASVLDQDWAIEHNAWDGDCATWQDYHDPQKENAPLYDVMNGTGPFKLEYWDHATGDVALVRNDAYWQAPAQLERIVIKKVNEWSTRKLMLQNGDADIVSVNRQFIDQVDGMPGVRLIRGQVRMSLGYLFMNQAIKAEGNNHIGSGQLDGEGIPPDFFSDVNVRKGFNHVFDWKTYIEQAIKGEAEQAKGPIPFGVPYFNPENPTYNFDLEQAETYFKRAWDGEVWDKGFKFTAIYVSGGEASKTALEILKRNLRKVNEKFEMEIQNVEWSTLLSKRLDKSAVFSPAAWLEDYHDAHNWVFPLMHTEGVYGSELGLSTAYNALIEQGISELEPEKRQDIYHELQRLAYEDAIVIFSTQALGRHYQRDWVDGYYFNPIWPGRNFYVLSKKLDARPNEAYTGALNLTVEQW